MLQDGDDSAEKMPPRFGTVGNKVSGSDFFGREQVMRKFWQLIRDEDAHILVVAPRRVGKSSILQYVVDNAPDNWIPVLVDFFRADAVDGLHPTLVGLAEHAAQGVWLGDTLRAFFGRVESANRATLCVKFREKDQQDGTGCCRGVGRGAQGSCDERTEGLAPDRRTAADAFGPDRQQGRDGEAIDYGCFLRVACSAQSRRP